MLIYYPKFINTVLKYSFWSRESCEDEQKFLFIVFLKDVEGKLFEKFCIYSCWSQVNLYKNKNPFRKRQGVLLRRAHNGWGENISFHPIYNLCTDATIVEEAKMNFE